MPSIDLHAPRSVSLDIELASVPFESFCGHPAPSRFRGTFETALRSPENVPCLKTTDSTRGLEECSSDPSAPSPLRGACQSPSARPRVPPSLRPGHQRFKAPKNLSTPCDSAFDPASFACVESPSRLRRTRPITLLTLPIQSSQRTCNPSCTNLRRALYISSCSPLVPTGPLLQTPIRLL